METSQYMFTNEALQSSISQKRDTHLEEWGSKQAKKSRADRRSSTSVAMSEIDATLLKLAEWSPPPFNYIILKVKEGTPYSAQAEPRRSKKKKGGL